MSKSCKRKPFEDYQDLNLRVNIPSESMSDVQHNEEHAEDNAAVLSGENNTSFQKGGSSPDGQCVDIALKEIIPDLETSQTCKPSHHQDSFNESGSQVAYSSGTPRTISSQKLADNLKTNNFSSKKFKCNFCSKQFLKRKRMTQHQWLHKKKPFKCEECDRCFSQKDKLVIHQAKHSGAKPFVCEICKKSFAKKYILDGHLVVHFGEKQFKCEICEYPFTRRSDLLRHHRVVHCEPTGEFKCNSCDKTFLNKNYLARHQVLHSGEKPFQCSLCDKSFSRKQYLVDHQSVHTGERPYECPVCYKDFTKRSSLVAHQVLHLGVKPFHCLLCDKSFSCKSNLVAHQKTHKSNR